MLSAEDFFDLTEFTYQSLFEKTEYVWDALKRLEDYIQDTLDPNISELRKKGEILPKTYAIYEGKLIEHFTLKREEATRGRTQVVVDGEVLVGASIFYAGVSLLNDDVSIGKGTIVEPGALIKGPTIIGDNTEVRQGAYIRGNVMIGNRCVVGHTTISETAS